MNVTRAFFPSLPQVATQGERADEGGSGREREEADRDVRRSARGRERARESSRLERRRRDVDVPLIERDDVADKAIRCDIEHQRARPRGEIRPRERARARLPAREEREKKREREADCQNFPRSRRSIEIPRPVRRGDASAFTSAYRSSVGPLAATGEASRDVCYGYTHRDHPFLPSTITPIAIIGDSVAPSAFRFYTRDLAYRARVGESARAYRSDVFLPGLAP